MIKGHILGLQMGIFFSSLARLYFGAHLHGLLVRVERIGEQYHSFSTVRHRIWGGWSMSLCALYTPAWVDFYMKDCRRNRKSR
jgi:hypothetical protein